MLLFPSHPLCLEHKKIKSPVSRWQHSVRDEPYQVDNGWGIEDKLQDCAAQDYIGRTGKASGRQGPFVHTGNGSDWSRLQYELGQAFHAGNVRIAKGFNYSADYYGSGLQRGKTWHNTARAASRQRRRR